MWCRWAKPVWYEAMRRYVLNSPVLTDYGVWRFAGPVAPEDARAWAQAGFVSAVGHEGAALLLSGILRQPVPVNRVRVALEAGDQALVLRVLERLPEATVLDLSRMEVTGWQLGLLTRME